MLKRKISFLCFILTIVITLSGCNTSQVNSSPMELKPSLDDTSKIVDDKPEIVESVSTINISSTHQDKIELPTVKSIDELLTKLEEGRADISYRGVDSIVMNDAIMAAPAAGVEESTRDFSTTNSQVDGVEEGELIKTDGEHIYLASKNEINIIKIDGKDMELLSTIKIKNIERIEEMYITDNRIVTIGSLFEEIELPKIPEDKNKDDSNYYRRWYPTNYTRHQTKYTIIDITNRKNPKEIQELKVSGSNLTTRLMGNTLYYVTNNQSHSSIPFDLYREFNIKVDDQLILPYFTNSLLPNNTLIPANKIMYFPGSQENSFLTIGSFNLSGDDKSIPEVYYGGGAYFYMDTEHIVVACQDWGRDVSLTNLFKFNIYGKDIVHTAQGSVKGHPINQYSMDIHKGNFRIATTLNWRDGNNMYVLDKDFKEIGIVSNIAPSERIYSVRFMGDMAYMVTFRNTDPLYALDMSNPKKPTILGELKIPGFSQYLHPVGDDLLVGFGRNTEEIISIQNGIPVSQGVRDIGLKISLFDVSDATELKEISILTYGDQELYSEAFTNPRAIMVDAKKQIFGFPVIGFDGDSEQMYDINPSDIWYGGIVISVENEKLKETKRIEHGRLSDESYLYNITPDMYMTRMVYIDDYLYIVGANKISAFDYNSFKLLKTLDLK